jgi:hypothetical protein
MVERGKSRMDQKKYAMRTRAQPIRMLQAQPTRMLLSTHLINMEIKQCPEENG